MHSPPSLTGGDFRPCENSMMNPGFVRNQPASVAECLSILFKNRIFEINPTVSHVNHRSSTGHGDADPEVPV
jgi:hypothetical protein